MDDSKPAIPFEFEDCDAFLASLDENSVALLNQKVSQDLLLQQQQQHNSQASSQQAIMGQPTISDYVSMSAAMTDSSPPSDWSRLQQETFGPSAQTLNPYASHQMDPFTIQQQQSQQQQQQQPQSISSQQPTTYSSNTTPLSSPVTVNSVESDSANGVFIGSNVVYPPTNATSPATGLTYTANDSFDPSYNSAGYPISPPYPSAATTSSVGDGSISSPEGAYSGNSSFDYSNSASLSTSANNIATASLIPNLLPHQSLSLQQPQPQPQPQLMQSPSQQAQQQPSPQQLNSQFDYHDDQELSPHTAANPGSPEDGSPQPYSPQAEGSPQYSPGAYSPGEYKDSNGKIKTFKKERQHSATRIDAKGNKISKPKKEKTSHNMIEKRYRTNINDKILALRDCVPSLRCVVNGTPRTTEELEGLTPASKLNKATVLTKATEYILHLQKRNAILIKELNDLRVGRAEPSGILPNDMAPTGLPPNGLAAYSALQSQDLQSQTINNSLASKVMMCSMATLMGAGLMNEGSDTQGLSFFPGLSFLSSLKVGPWDTSSVIYGFKLLLVLGTIYYVVSPLFYASSTKQEDSKDQHFAGSEADADSGSLNFELSDIRKQTWLRNIRIVNLPSDNLSSQISAFIRSLIQIVLTSVMGAEGYETIGSSFDGEPLAVKRDALSNAIDAQLCGGDVTNSRGSLFYTLVQSFTLPASPSRYFLQAMQVNILFYNTPGFSYLGSKLSNYLWNKARSTALPANKSNNEEDESSFDDFHMAKHIISLLNSDDVFNPRTVQRLQNVAFNKAVSEGCPLGDDDEGYISVVTDKSIRSSHDVLAALQANSLLHEVLLCVLENDEIDFRKLELCAKISPPRSIVARRVAIAEALLLGPKDASYAKNAMEMLKEELNQQAWINKEFALSTVYPSQVPITVSRSRSNSHTTVNTITLGSGSETDHEDESALSSSESSSIMSNDDEYENGVSCSESEESVATEQGDNVAFLSTSVKSSSIPFAVSQDSRLGIRFSLIICYLARNMTGPAFQLLQKVEINKLESIGLLGFIAMWKTLEEMYDRKFTASRHKLEDLSAIARIWLGGNIGSEEGLSLERLRFLVGESVGMSKFFGGFECELDEGYGTQ